MNLGDIIVAINALDQGDLAALLTAIAGRMAHVREQPDEAAPAAPAAGDTVDADLVLTAAQAALLLGLAKSRVYEMLRCGDLPAVRYGRLVRVRAAAVQSYIEGHERRGRLAVYVSDMLTINNDRGTVPAAPQGAGPHAKATRRRTGCASPNGVAVGARFRAGAHSVGETDDAARSPTKV